MFKHPENLLEVLDQSTGMVYRVVGDNPALPKGWLFRADRDLYVRGQEDDRWRMYPVICRDEGNIESWGTDYGGYNWLSRIKVEFVERRKRNLNDEP